MNRRKFIAATGTCSLVGLSGCMDSVLGPRPQVADTDTNYGSLQSTVGDSTFRVLVVNQGSRGEVRVILKFVTDNEVVIEDHSKTVIMNKDERRRVDFEVDVPNDTDAYLAQAEPV